MDFFQAQDKARKRSGRLIIYYLTAVLAIVLSIYAVLFWLSGATPEKYSDDTLLTRYWDPHLFLGTAAGIILVVGLGSIVKILSLRSGGGSVARSLGGRLVDTSTTNLQEKRLLNVVEEIAIASGIRVPEVYILPEKGINAFAAGYSPDDAAVAITQGAMDSLNRDELQGVIAHEFSHILNGDMRLNIRLIGLLFGIFLIAIIGRVIMRSSLYSRSSSKDNKGGAAVFAILGIALFIIGYIGVLFGRLIQAAVSRQREYLADASAVQFTRNPDGIAGALKKIGRAACGGRIANAHASETSHLFFAEALSGSFLELFATHPPLKNRIKAIDPSFNGDFNAVSSRSAPPKRNSPSRPAISKRSSPIPNQTFPISRNTFIAAVVAASAGAPSHTLNTIPHPLYLAAHDPLHVKALILSLLCDIHESDQVSEKQEVIVNTCLSPTEKTFYREVLLQMHSLPDQLRLSLLDIALPTLKTLKEEQRSSFIKALNDFIIADGNISLREFSYLRIIERALCPSKRNQHQTSSRKKLLKPISMLINMLAQCGSNQPELAFKVGAKVFEHWNEEFLFVRDIALDTKVLAHVLSQLEQASEDIKKLLLEALSDTVASDGKIESTELEILRAVAAALGCPAPAISSP